MSRFFIAQPFLVIEDRDCSGCVPLGRPSRDTITLRKGNLARVTQMYLPIQEHRPHGDIEKPNDCGTRELHKRVFRSHNLKNTT